MNTTTTKQVDEIIDQFDMYLRRGVYNDWKMNDRFLRFVLDRSQTPSYQGRKTVKICAYTGKQSTVQADPKREHLTPEQEKELREVMTLMDGFDLPTRSKDSWYAKRDLERSQTSYAQDKYVEQARWTSSDELYARITKIPPEMQTSILVIAIVIYLLRILDAEFDCETATFGEFYENYSHVVLASYSFLDK